MTVVIQKEAVVETVENGCKCKRRGKSKKSQRRETVKSVKQFLSRG